MMCVFIYASFLFTSNNPKNCELKKLDTIFHPIEKQMTKNHNFKYIYMHVYMPTTHVNTTTHLFFSLIQREFSNWKSKQQKNKQA